MNKEMMDSIFVLVLLAIIFGGVIALIGMGLYFSHKQRMAEIERGDHECEESKP